MLRSFTGDLATCLASGTQIRSHQIQLHTLKNTQDRIATKLPGYPPDTKNEMYKCSQKSWISDQYTDTKKEEVTNLLRGNYPCKTAFPLRIAAQSLRGTDSSICPFMELGCLIKKKSGHLENAWMKACCSSQVSVHSHVFEAE